LCCWIGTPLNPTFRQALEDYYSQMEDLAWTPGSFLNE
jgi:hypothetical protein